MFLILLSAVVFGVSIIIKPIENLSQYVSISRKVAILLAFVGLISKCVVQIDAGHVGVQKLFGSVKTKVLQSGLHVVNPFVNIVEFNIRTQNYTMSQVSNEGQVKGDDAIRVLSADGLEVIIDLTVLFRINSTDAPQIVKEIGSQISEIIVRPVSRTKIRDNAVYYDAVSLYSTKRDEFQQRIFKDIDTEFKKRGLILENLLVRNITLPESVRKTIESKINAEQDAQKMEFVLQKEKQEAERKRVEAQGIADYQRILSTQLTDKMLQYEQIKAQKEIALSPNAKVIVMNGKNTPIILGNQ